MRGGRRRRARRRNSRGQEREGGRLAHRNPELPLRWTNFSLRANFAFDKTAHFTFRTSASSGTEITFCDNEQVSRNTVERKDDRACSRERRISQSARSEFLNKVGLYKRVLLKIIFPEQLDLLTIKLSQC